METKALPVYSERLVLCRNAAKLSQKEVAEKLQIKQSTISKYETGVNVPQIKYMLKLSQLYDKPLTWLFFEN